ncbi:MAG: sodium-dependent bicarbonate transport family permease [Ignavibacteria bacterium]|nr:sodium-dependent bicarbonate transport family permease [Ignavibacteria bacterium]
MENLIDPVILFFAVGLLAGIIKAELKIPEAIYEILSIYLLLAIGLKGGVQLATVELQTILKPVFGTLFIGIIIPFIAFIILRKIGKLDRYNSAAIAAHYGSVSAVTFAVVLTFLEKFNVPYESYSTILLVILEIPAIGVGILLARIGSGKQFLFKTELYKEIFLSRSIYLLLAGVAIGYVAGPQKIEPIKLIFFDLFKGLLSIFLLEMGLVASKRLADLKKVGVFLFFFAICMPIISASITIFVGKIVGLSLGGTTVLATLAASASYIAAPAAIRIAIPEANPTFYLTASLGITFPFNLIFGIPLYYNLAKLIY